MAAMSLSTDPDADVVMKLFHAGIQFWVCARSAESGIFDIIETRYKDGVTLEELVKELTSEREITEKLLHMLVALQLLTKSSGHGGQVVYRNTPAARKYLTTSETSLIPYLKIVESATRRTDTCMTSTLRTGSSRSFYSDLTPQDSDEREKATSRAQATNEFGVAMDAVAIVHIPAVERAFDFSSFKTIVDIGGGYGRLGMEFVKVYPQVSFTVFELWEVVTLARRYRNVDDLTGVKFLIGDVFKDELPSADLYILCHVIQNWSESAIMEILAKVRKSLSPGGALLVLEKALSEDKTGPQLPVIIDLGGAMLGFDGGYRPGTEYIQFLEQAGFKDIQLKRIEGYNDHDAFLAGTSS